MSAKKTDTPSEKIELEDLLRVKRAERPGEDFWNRFDRELHQRMLQTLVRKDPWYVQMGRALSGRFAQSAAVASAAALVAMVVVRPAFIGVGSADMAETAADTAINVAQVQSAAEVAGQAATAATSRPAVAGHDYKIDSIRGAEAASDQGFTREFGLDSIEVASFDRVAYSADSVSSRVFSQPGVATSLVY